eukprot:5596465-Prorocentrum_lima.AAC.1
MPPMVSVCGVMGAAMGATRGRGGWSAAVVGCSTVGGCVPSRGRRGSGSVSARGLRGRRRFGRAAALSSEGGCGGGGCPA